MLRRISKWLGGNRGRQTSRKPTSRRASLGVEGLETRDLMSASPAGFLLSNGNLYNTALSLTKPIDTGVQQFTVVNNEVFDLHSDGNLHSLNLNGTNNIVQDNWITKFVAGSDGTAYTLGANGHFDIDGVMRQASVTSFQLSPDGSVYTLDLRNELWRYTGAKGFVQIGWNAVNFQVSPDGSVYGLNTVKQLFRYTVSSGVFTQIGSNAVNFQVSPDGSVYGLNTVKQLFRYTVSSGVFTQIGSNVVNFQVSPDGSVYGLNTVKQLFRYTVSSGVFTQIGSNAVNFQVSPDGSVYGLNTVKQLFRYTVSSGVFTQIGSGISIFAVAGDGAVYAEDTGYRMWRYTAGAGWYLVPKNLTGGADDRDGLEREPADVDRAVGIGEQTSDRVSAKQAGCRRKVRGRVSIRLTPGPFVRRHQQASALAARRASEGPTLAGALGCQRTRLADFLAVPVAVSASPL